MTASAPEPVLQFQLRTGIQIHIRIHIHHPDSQSYWSQRNLQKRLTEDYRDKLNLAMACIGLLHWQEKLQILTNIAIGF